jgi:hypothetical protein
MNSLSYSWMLPLLSLSTSTTNQTSQLPSHILPLTFQSSPMLPLYLPTSLSSQSSFPSTLSLLLQFLSFLKTSILLSPFSLHFQLAFQYLSWTYCTSPLLHVLHSLPESLTTQTASRFYPSFPTVYPSIISFLPLSTVSTPNTHWTCLSFLCISSPFSILPPYMLRSLHCMDHSLSPLTSSSHLLTSLIPLLTSRSQLLMSTLVTITVVHILILISLWGAYTFHVKPWNDWILFASCQVLA